VVRCPDIETCQPSYEQQQSGAAALTDFALHLVSKLSVASPRGVPFSTKIVGTCCEETADRGNTVVLRCRRGPTRQQSLSRLKTDKEWDNTVEDDFFNPSEKEESVLNLDGSSNDTSSRSASPLFLETDRKSDSGSLSLSSDGRSSDVEFSDMDVSDADISSIHSEDTESDNILDDMNHSAQGSCDICSKAMLYHFHCDNCGHGNFDICRSGWERGSWCTDQKHHLRECTHWGHQSGRKISFEDLIPEQELQVFDVGLCRKETSSPSLSILVRVRMGPQA
jgi:hypothetical protein